MKPSKVVRFRMDEDKFYDVKMLAEIKEISITAMLNKLITDALSSKEIYNEIKQDIQT